MRQPKRSHEHSRNFSLHRRRKLDIIPVCQFNHHLWAPTSPASAPLPKRTWPTASCPSPCAPSSCPASPSSSAAWNNSSSNGNPAPFRLPRHPASKSSLCKATLPLALVLPLGYPLGDPTAVHARFDVSTSSPPRPKPPSPSFGQPTLWQHSFHPPRSARSHPRIRHAHHHACRAPDRFGELPEPHICAFFVTILQLNKDVYLPLMGPRRTWTETAPTTQSQCGGDNRAWVCTTDGKQVPSHGDGETERSKHGRC